MDKCIYINCGRTAFKGLCEGHRDLIRREDTVALVCWECGTIEALLLKQEIIDTFNLDEVQLKKYIYVKKCHLCNGGESQLNVIRNKEGFIL